MIGLPDLLHPSSAKEKETHQERQRKDKRKGYSLEQAQSSLLSFFVLPLILLRGRRSRPARKAALPLWLAHLQSIFPTEGARACSQPHAHSIPFHIPACGSQALHQAIGWNLERRSPLRHHLHSLLAILPILSRGYEPAAARPEWSW